MLFYLDMRQIKITEQQLKNIIVGEGFSFEPYYVKNKDGNTVKRQKNGISSKFKYPIQKRCNQ